MEKERRERGEEKGIEGWRNGRRIDGGRWGTREGGGFLNKLRMPLRAQDFGISQVSA